MASTYSFKFTVGQKFYNGRYEVVKVTPSFVTFRIIRNYDTFRRKPIEIAPHSYEDIDGQMRLSVISYTAKLPMEEREISLRAGGGLWLDKEHCDGWMASLLRTAPAPPRPPRVVRREAPVPRSNLPPSQ